MSDSLYDKAFRTLVTDCRRLILPLINDVFGMDYKGNEEILLLQNEHFVNDVESIGERIVDSTFLVVGKGNSRKRYHIECQTNEDSSILLRIFEYDAKIALDHGALNERTRLIVEFPNTCLICLRSKDRTPDRMMIEIRTQGGSVSYDVPVIKAKEISVEEIFDKGFFCMIPFHIFKYEKDFKEIEADPEREKELFNVYKDIDRRLEEAQKKGAINADEEQMIRELSKKIVGQLASKQENIKKGVSSIMVGATLDYPGRETVLKHQQELRETARRERSEGLSEGRTEGRTEERLIIQSIGKYMREHPGEKDSKIAKFASEKHGISEEEAVAAIEVVRELNGQPPKRTINTKLKR